MAQLLPRIVIVTRPSELTLLVSEHGTREQARFAVSEEGRDFNELVVRDERQRDAVRAVTASLPPAWRRATINRDDLATFLFDSGDVVVAIGQDGLVPNVAKYLDTQLVLGINPDPENYEGLLVRHSVREAGALLERAVAERVAFERRTMVEARLDDGQSLRALNEIFVGQRQHQSAKYRLTANGAQERHSSSGFIVATGTGCTGWARSIARERKDAVTPPAPTQRALALYVREAFPAPGFGTSLTAAVLNESAATAVSEMTSGGVIFGDGIEDDFLRFGWGRRVEITTASNSLRLIV